MVEKQERPLEPTPPTGPTLAAEVFCLQIIAAQDFILQFTLLDQLHVFMIPVHTCKSGCSRGCQRDCCKRTCVETTSTCKGAMTDFHLLFFNVWYSTVTLCQSYLKLVVRKVHPLYMAHPCCTEGQRRGTQFYESFAAVGDSPGGWIISNPKGIC